MRYLDLIRPRGQIDQVIFLSEIGEMANCILRLDGEPVIIHLPRRSNIEVAGGGRENLIVKAVRLGPGFGEKETILCLTEPPSYFPLENALCRCLLALGFKVMDGGKMAA